MQILKFQKHRKGLTHLQLIVGIFKLANISVT